MCEDITSENGRKPAGPCPDISMEMQAIDAAMDEDQDRLQEILAEMALWEIHTLLEAAVELTRATSARYHALGGDPFQKPERPY